MIIQLNADKAVNVDNIFTCSKHTQITKTPGLPEKKDSFRIFVTSINGSSDTIHFDSEYELNAAWIKLMGNG